MITKCLKKNKKNIEEICKINLDNYLKILEKYYVKLMSHSLMIESKFKKFGSDMLHKLTLKLKNL